ncbi:MAG: tetratricopeptide repeat protein [Deltaproteobacteria bacterium]|nr:tetratricopeptide repeat protein [Deltaproteobacteria bacterium]
MKLLQRKPEEAQSLFEKALSADPDFLPALQHLVNIHIRNKEPAKAIARCKQQIAKIPDNANLYVLLGKVYFFQKDYDKARQNYDKALDMDPDNMDALFSLARLEEAQGSIDTAIDKYRQIRARKPENAAVSMLLATLLERRGDAVEAKQIYEDVLDKHPGSSAAANNLAFYYAEHEPTKENLARAQELIGPLATRFKDNADVVDTAAWVAYRKGDLEKARDLLEAVSDKSESRPIIKYHLGMIYLGLGEKDRARAALQDATQDAEDYPGRGEAEKALAALVNGER